MTDTTAPPFDGSAITLDAAVAAVTAEVQAAGADHVYEPADDFKCRYVEEDRPACLIGRALRRLGMPLADLEAHNTERIDPRRPYSSSPEPFDLAADVRTFFGYIQRDQDVQRPWGRALRQGLRWLEAESGLAHEVQPDTLVAAHRAAHAVAGAE